MWLKAEAVLYASRGVDIGVIAEMVDRRDRPVRDWLSGWGRSRLCSVVTGRAGNENAAKFTRAQKQEVRRALGEPSLQCGVKADF